MYIGSKKIIEQGVIVERDRKLVIESDCDGELIYMLWGDTSLPPKGDSDVPVLYSLCRVIACIAAKVGAFRNLESHIIKRITQEAVDSIYLMLGIYLHQIS